MPTAGRPPTLGSHSGSSNAFTLSADPLSSPPRGIERPVVGHPGVPLPGSSEPCQLYHVTCGPSPPGCFSSTTMASQKGAGGSLSLQLQEAGCPLDILLLGVGPLHLPPASSSDVEVCTLPPPHHRLSERRPWEPQPRHPDVCTQHLSPPRGPNSPFLLQSRARAGGTEPQGLPSRAPCLFCNVQLTAVQPDVDQSTKDTSMFLCASLGSPQRPLPWEIGAAQGPLGLQRRWWVGFAVPAATRQDDTGRWDMQDGVQAGDGEGAAWAD